MKSTYWPSVRRFFTWRLLLLLALYAAGFQFVLDLSNWLQQEDQPFSLSTSLVQFSINYPNLLLLSYLNFCLIRVLDHYNPWDGKRSGLIRIMIEFFAAALIVFLQVIIVNVLISVFQGAPIDFRSFAFSAMIGVIINLILLPTMEFYYQYTRRYEVALDNEWLKKENLKFQYEVLKNQLNPHFLFNSLNSLSSLVSIDQAKAKEFIQKLSQVYRHVLENREKELITLEEEIKFIEGYIYLLKTRFGDDLQVNIQVNEEYLKKRVVPMAVQTLIENAVKHNAVLEDKPLVVYIHSDGVSLIVCNNLQPKRSIASPGIGLENLKNSYKLHKRDVKVLPGPGSFQVSLPLL